MKKGKRTIRARVWGSRPVLWFRHLNRNAQLAVILVLVLMITGGLAFGLTGGSTEEVEQAQETPEEIEVANLSTVTLSYYEGTVEYSVDAGENWEDVEQDQQLEQGTYLRTIGALSKAVIAFDDQSELRIDANSEIELQTMTTERAFIKQENGYTYARLLNDRDQDLVIRTNNAQFEAAGTAFRTITTGDVEAAEVYESLVRETVTNREATTGEKIVITEDSGTVSSEVENIDIDEIKENEFVQWNRQRDQDNDLFKDSLGFLSDFDGPEITITSPQAGSTVRVSDGDNPTVVFEGTAENGTQLTVQSKSVSGSQPQSVTVADGKFKTSEVQAAIGTSVFEFVGKDRRGNETKVTLSLTVVREASVQEQGIQIDVSQTGDTVTVEWIAVGISVDDGVYIAYDKDSGPVYPDSPSKLTKKSKITIDKADAGMTSGDTWYFRACRYLKNSDTCDNYSNQKSIEIE